MIFCYTGIFAEFLITSQAKLIIKLDIILRTFYNKTHVGHKFDKPSYSGCKYFYCLIIKTVIKTEFKVLRIMWSLINDLRVNDTIQFTLKLMIIGCFKINLKRMGYFIAGRICILQSKCIDEWLIKVKDILGLSFFK